MRTSLTDSGGRPVHLELDVRTPCAPQPLPPCPWAFPDPRRASAAGLISSGGDFEPATIVAAYRLGIFPWPHPEAEYLWFSPDPRAILPPENLKISRRLGRTIRSGGFHVTIDAAFEEVMRCCGECRPEGTWITPALLRGYVELHRLGWAHSVEVWTGEDELAGGLYGVGVGAMFGAESMFHRVRDASKVALAALAQHALAIGIELVDIQVLTEHTERMGGIEIPRSRYLTLLERATAHEAAWRTGQRA